MKKQEFSGKSLDDALDSAAAAFGVDRGAVRYEVLPDVKGGLLSKLFSRGVRIEAWFESRESLDMAARNAVREVMQKKSPESDRNQRGSDDRGVGAARGKHDRDGNRKSANQQGGKREPRPQGEKREPRPQGEKREPRPQAEKREPRPQGEKREPRPQGEQRPQRDAVGRREQREPREPRENREHREPRERPERSPDREFLTFEDPKVVEVLEEFRGVFLKMFEVPESNCKQERDNLGNVMLSVEDPFLEDTLAHSDKLAVAFEHLFKRVAQKRVGDVSSRVFLTAGNAGEIRQNKLRDYALSVAEKVKQTGKSMTVSSKTSQERRVMHMALDGYPGIATKSVGSGEHRKLVIFSTDRSRRPRAEEGSEGDAQARTGEGGGGRRRRRRRKSRGGQHQQGGASHARTQNETQPQSESGND